MPLGQGRPGMIVIVIVIVIAMTMDRKMEMNMIVEHMKQRLILIVSLGMSMTVVAVVGHLLSMFDSSVLVVAIVGSRRRQQRLQPWRRVHKDIRAG